MFEPRFYLEVPAMRPRKILNFLLLLVLFFSFLSSIAATWFLIGGKRNVAGLIATAFEGMEIRDGVLHPRSGQPYVPPPYLITPIMNQLLGLPAMFNHQADSLVVVDTSSTSGIPLRIPAILLKARNIVVVLAEETVMEFPYENVMLGTRDLVFTEERISAFLKKHAVTIFLGYFISAVVHEAALFFFSIFFLAFAAFIFRLDRSRTLKECVKTASFAISPIAIGNTLIAFSGVKVEWTWHILIFLSTIVMFRAIMAINGTNKDLRGTDQ